MKKFLNYLFLFVLIVIISELLFGYAIFQKLNKVRQEVITSELLDIVGGVIAQEG